jgi:hypothetical protein
MRPILSVWSGLGIGSSNLSLLSGGGDTRSYELVKSSNRQFAYWYLLRSTAGPEHTCSPIREISTCKPHDEHLIVGRNADSLSPCMTAKQCPVELFFRVVVQVLFQHEGKHRICQQRHVLQRSHDRWLSCLAVAGWLETRLFNTVESMRICETAVHTTPPVSAFFKFLLCPCIDPSSHRVGAAKAQPRCEEPLAESCSKLILFRQSVTAGTRIR